MAEENMEDVIEETPEAGGREDSGTENVSGEEVSQGGNPDGSPTGQADSQSEQADDRGKQADSQGKQADSRGKQADSQGRQADSQETEQQSESGEAESNPKEAAGKEKRKKRKDKRDEKIEELNDRLLRNMAEFENFRNRSEKEKTAMFEIGAKSVIEKVLPIVDNFDRAMDAVPEGEEESAFVKGMEAIYKQVSTVLEEIGVVPIEAVGKEFDPNLHNAVMHEEDDTMDANIICEEFQKGYMYKDSVVRHSMVKVVN